MSSASITELSFKSSAKDSETNCLFLSAGLLLAKKQLYGVSTKGSLCHFQLNLKQLLEKLMCFPKNSMFLGSFPLTDTFLTLFTKKEEIDLSLSAILCGQVTVLYYSSLGAFMSPVFETSAKKTYVIWFYSTFSFIGRPPPKCFRIP